MINEFVQVTEKNTNERVLINLRHIEYIREVNASASEDFSLIKLKDGRVQVHETFESFEEFFENNAD